MALILGPSRGIAELLGHPTRPAPPPTPPVPGITRTDKRYGSPIPLVLGRGVVPSQLVYQANPTTGTGQVWNGYGWTYERQRLAIDVVIALCEAPVTSVLRCYRKAGSSVVSIPAAQFADRLALQTTGIVDVVTAATATAWSGYVGTTSEGLAHSGTCHVRIKNSTLDDEGTIGETRWEIQGSDCVTSVSTPDAEPAEILLFLLTNAVHGLGFDPAVVNVENGIDGLAASGYRRYTRARGWYLSRVIERGTRIVQIIEELLAATNSTVVWVDGVLTAVPLDDEASSATAGWPGHALYPYSPVTATTAVGDLDFASGDEDPVRVRREPRSAVFSVWPVDYTLRKDDAGEITYDVNHAEYQSDVWSGANNLRRAEVLDLTPWIMSESQAWFVSYLTAQRSMYHRSKYAFRVKPRLTRLAPGDFVSLSDSVLGISGVDCRVETAAEDEDRNLEVAALEWPRGTTKSFTLPTTPPIGRVAQGTARTLAATNLLNVPPGSIGAGNLVRNSSFEVDSNADGVADGWAEYNNSAGLEPATKSIQAGGVYGGSCQRISWVVNNTTSKGFYTTSGLTVGSLAAGVRGGWAQNTWYVVSFWARASGTNVGQVTDLRWTTNPTEQVAVANPALSASWQRYVFQVRWTTVPTDGELYPTIAYGSGTNGTLDLDAVQVEEGTAASAYAAMSDEILPGAVGSTELAPAAVTETRVADASISTPKLVVGAVTASKIATDALATTDFAEAYQATPKEMVASAGVKLIASANYAAWAASTVYATGDVRKNGGNLYVCTQAGTSAASGGPTGQDFYNEVTDNTAKWKYLPQLRVGPGGAQVGSYLLSESVLASLTALARTGVATSDVMWFRGNINPNYNFGAPVFCDPLWAQSTLFKVGARVQGDPSPAGYPLAEYNAASGNKATKVYRCITEGTSAATGNGPTGTTADITDGTAHWAYVEAATNTIERLKLYGEIGITYDSFVTQLLAVRCVLQPRADNDNLDGLRYLRVKWYTTAAILQHTSYHAMPDRLYRTPATPTDAGNAYSLILPSMVRGSPQMVYATGAFVFNGYLRVKLFGVQGETPERDHGQAPNNMTTVFPSGGILIGGTGGEGGGGGGGGGGCPAPEAGVLLADGTYRPAGLLQIGDAIWSVGEDDGPGTYAVTAVKVLARSARAAISLDDGTRVIYSPRHLIMTPSGWRAVGGLRAGERVLTVRGPRHVTSVLSAADGPVVRIATSCRTYVTEGGILNHNLKPT